MAKIEKQRVPFTQIANEIINDKELSWKAKGIFAYLFSKPEDWDFSAKRICNDSSDGHKATLSGIKELEDKQYIIRKKFGSGRLLYLLRYAHFDPSTQNGDLDTNPDSPNGKEPKRLVAQIGTISNKESDNNKEEKVILSDGQAIATIIELFKDINPSYKSWFKNTTQRKAISVLLESHGQEKITRAIALLPKTNIVPYITTITTPYMLESKWALWESQIKKKMAEKQNNTKGIISST